MQLVPVAGRVSHLLENWAVVTKDQWIVKAIRGVEIEFSQPPYQEGPPHPLYLPEKGMSLMRPKCWAREQYASCSFFYAQSFLKDIESGL